MGVRWEFGPEKINSLNDEIKKNSQKITSLESEVNNINTNFNNYYNKNEINQKENELNQLITNNTNDIRNLKWVVLNNISRENARTTINIEGKRFIHLQGRFTPFSTDTGTWYSFNPFFIDTQNYNYPVRITLYDWNTQQIVGSAQISINSQNMILECFDTNNRSISRYLWGNVLGTN